MSSSRIELLIVLLCSRQDSLHLFPVTRCPSPDLLLNQNENFASQPLFLYHGIYSHEHKLPLLHVEIQVVALKHLELAHEFDLGVEGFAGAAFGTRRRKYS